MMESPEPVTHNLITVQHSEEQKRNVTKGAESLEGKKKKWLEQIVKETACTYKVKN